MDIRLTQGTPADSVRWKKMYWVNPKLSDSAVRQASADSLWYITDGLYQSLRVIYGPYPTVDGATLAAETLVHMMGETK
jgi:hypothetical protein